MNQKIDRYALVVGAIFITAIGAVWLFQSPSAEEAFGSLGKLWDIRQGCFSGWSPHFLLGGSLVIQQAAIVIALISNLSIVIFGPWIGELAALKLVALLSLAMSGVTMFFFVRRWTSDVSQAVVAALAYIMLPSMTVAIAIYEHFNVTVCFVFLPLILRGILVLSEASEEVSPREIIGLGLAASAVALSCTKIAVALSPILLLWTLEVLRLQPATSRWKIIIRYAVSAGMALIFTLPFLLPASREFGLAAVFLFDPLEGWQHHYAFKSALQWIDLSGYFMRGADPTVTADSVMFTIGLLPLTILSLALGLSSLKEWRHSLLGRRFLMLVACWLLAFALAAGPDGILLGHWNLLKNSARGMSDFTIPFLWLALAWLGWISYQTIYQLIGGRVWRSWFLLALFLATPFFLIALFFPLFRDIRAPESFAIVGGCCFLAAALGMATIALFTRIIPIRFRLVSAIAMALLFLLELSPIYSAYWTRGLPEELFTDVDQALAFLKEAPLPGRIYPISSRYFYLTIPQQTGRSLTTEALLRHFELKWVRHFEVAGAATIDAMKSYLNLSGVSYIFIDKEDPMTPKQVQELYRTLFPVVFENRFIAILANEGSLYPAFFALAAVALPLDGYQSAPLGLQLAKMNLLGVELAPFDQRVSGLAGKATGSREVELLPEYREHGGAPFQPLPSVGRWADDDRMTYRLPPTLSGWLTVTEAFHPDWTATIDGQPVPTYRAAVALLSVYIPLGSQEVVFKFIQPYWYNLLFYFGISLWVLALAAFFLFSSCWMRLSRWKCLRGRMPITTDTKHKE
jgi:hypothetical protein